MTHQKYSLEQAEELEWNEYVKSCSEKYLQFTDTFKVEALKQDIEWKYHRDIFRDAGFPDFIVTSAVPKESLWNWRHVLKHHWWEWVMSKKKWRKKQEKIDISKMTLEEQNEYLRAEVAYLRELYAFVHEKSP